MVNDYSTEIISKKMDANSKEDKLLFINLGGCKENEFEEYHYKMISVAKNLALASKTTKKISIFKQSGFKKILSYIDDKYRIDVDDIYNVNVKLTEHFKERYSIKIVKLNTTVAKPIKYWICEIKQTATILIFTNKL